VQLHTHRHFTAAYVTLARLYVAQPPVPSPSRTGVVRDLGCVAVELAPGGNRLLLASGRQFNPFFALAETSWIVAGEQNVASLKPFVANIGQYSDDGVTFNGAYGHRLRHHFGYDQLERACDLLRADPTSRRIVLTLWSADDLGSLSRDVPCNVVLSLKTSANQLLMTVFNRSNDFYRGFAYDVFAFSGLQSSIASRAGLVPGRYLHFTDSLHVYDTDHAAVCGVANGNDPDRLALALDSLPRAPYQWQPGAGADVDGAHAVDDVAARAYDAWKAGRCQSAFDVLREDEIGVAVVLYLRNKHGFAGCQLPSWFPQRSTQGGWAV
jgi:hypothetical protein